MTKKSVQNAKEQKPKDEASPQPVENVAQEQPQEANVEDAGPSIKSILAKVDPKKLKLADEMGIPLGELLIWAESIEVKQNIILEGLKKLPTEEGIAQEIHKKMMERSSQVRTQMQTQASQGGGKSDLADLMMLMKELSGGGGGGESGFFADVGKNYLLKKLSSEDFGDFMAKEMFKRIMPDAMQKYEEEIMKKAKEQGQKAGQGN